MLIILIFFVYFLLYSFILLKFHFRNQNSSHHNFCFITQVLLNCTQRFSYEQYGSKLAFAFRHANSKSFLFCFFFSLIKAKSQRFCGLHKNTQTQRLSPKPVLFIGCVSKCYFLSSDRRGLYSILVSLNQFVSILAQIRSVRLFFVLNSTIR